MVTDPTGRMVYGGSYYGIYALASDAVTGRLTNAAPCCGNEYYYGYGVTAFGFANRLYYGMAMHPNGQFLFAARANGGQLDVFRVDGGNGGLTLAATYATGSNPYSVVVDPTGKFVYVGNQTNQSVSAYTIDTTTGGLTPVTGSPFALANSNPMALAVDSNGTHLYVASSNGGVEGYTIDTTTGALAAVSGSPYATECCTMFGGIAVDATGRFLYLQNYVQGQVYGFSVDQVSGALTPLSGSPFPSGPNAYAVAIDASNRFLYVGSQNGTSAVVALAINQTTGALAAVPGSPFPARGCRHW